MTRCSAIPLGGSPSNRNTTPIWIARLRERCRWHAYRGRDGGWVRARAACRRRRCHGECDGVGRLASGWARAPVPRARSPAPSPEPRADAPPFHRNPHPPHPAPVHHRARRPERVPHRDGQDRRWRWHRGMGRGCADALLRRDARDGPGGPATYAPLLGDDPFELEAIERRLETTLKRNASARAAISAALHDLVGKRLGHSALAVLGARPRAGAAIDVHHRHRHAGE